MASPTSFQSTGPTFADRRTVSTTATVTGTDYLLLCDATSAGFTVTVPAASAAYKNQVVVIKKTDTTFNVITIATGYASTLNTVNETTTIQCDGTSWVQVARYVPSEWTTFTPTITNFGSTSSVTFYWKRIGDSIAIQGYFVMGTGGAGVASISLPTGLTTDTNKLNSSNNTACGRLVADTAANDSPYTIVIDPATLTLMKVGRLQAALSPLNGTSFVASSKLAVHGVIVAILGWNG